jgi:pectate lyase
MGDSVRIQLASLGLLAAASALAPCARAIPSFPGAEGWGAVTVGGRGGAVYHVTNLNDSGPGSFRAACEASGPRTVVFDVSGIIQLTNEVQITNSNITIAGQTAPGDGVIVAGATVDMTGGVSDVLVRYLRFRRSYDKAKWQAWATNSSNPDPRGQCLVGMSTTSNIMVDHVSVSWGTDENMSIYRRYLNPPINPGGSTLVPTKNVTIQWCISAEALNPANHAYADTLGGQGANHHHNLLACNVGRNPSISFSHFMDWRNNVIFNWRDRTMDGAGAEAHMNVISNYYKPGPASGYDYQWNPIPLLKVRVVKPEIRQNGTNFGLNPKNRYCCPGAVGYWYVNGNIVEGYPEVSSNNWEGYSLVDGKKYNGVQWGGATSDAVILPYPVQDSPWYGDYMTNHLDWAQVTNVITHAEFVEDPDDPADGTNGAIFVIPDLPRIATQTTMDAYHSVLAGAGCTLPVRDAVDIRVTNMVVTGIATNGTNHLGIINHPDEVGGFPNLPVVTRAANWDTDGDGMPDDWELAHGLDPNAPADRNGDFDADGYSNLEEYLNEIGAFKAVEDIIWTGATNNRYAQIENWDIAFQPSRFDTAIISNAAVMVDAIGQDAGILRLTDNATLDITNGWLKIASRLEIGPNCTNNVKLTGQLIVTNDLVNDGTLRLKGAANLVVGGTFTNNGVLDIMTWTGTLPAGFVNNGVVLDRSLIRLLDPGIVGPDFQVRIDGYIGHNYQLQTREHLSGGTWQNVGTFVAGANARITFNHPDGVIAGQRFYRVAVE